MPAEQTLEQVPVILKILSNEIRWQIVQHLQSSDLKVSELVGLTAAATNQVSYHLAHMRNLGIVNERRSSADQRVVYYSLDVERLRDLYQQAGAQLHPVLGGEGLAEVAAETPTAPLRMLFLCTHNSARSQMGEGLARHLGKGQIEAFSAGTEATFVKPEAIEVLRQRGIDISAQTSKVLNEYVDQAFDYVITVCDDAREVCPVFPNGKHQLHWSFPDPSGVADPQERLAAFERVAQQLTTRLNFLLIVANREA